MVTRFGILDLTRLLQNVKCHWKKISVHVIGTMHMKKYATVRTTYHLLNTERIQQINTIE